MRYEELTIEGRNAVLEAFRSGKTIDRLFVLDGCQDGPVRTIVREAKKHDTIVNFVPKERLDSMSETGHHQGVMAYAAAYEYAEVEDILKIAEEKGEPPFLFLLDGIEDPHNLGAVIRSAEAAGASAVMIPKRGGALPTGTVVKTSAGAALRLPIAKTGNVSQTIRLLQEANFWVVGLSMEAEETLFKEDMPPRVVIVIGAEGDGLGQAVAKSCDELRHIPMAGKTGSLNASVAASLALFEYSRSNCDLERR